MPDGYIKMRAGEIRPVYAQETVTTGTLTISNQQTPTVTLYDALGNVVSGFEGISASGFDGLAQSAPRVWFLLDTTTLPVGYYTLTFRFLVEASDGTERTYAPNVEIQIVEAQR